MTNAKHFWCLGFYYINQRLAQNTEWFVVTSTTISLGEQKKDQDVTTVRKTKHSKIFRALSPKRAAL